MTLELLTVAVKNNAKAGPAQPHVSGAPERWTDFGIGRLRNHVSAEHSPNSFHGDGRCTGQRRGRTPEGA